METNEILRYYDLVFQDIVRNYAEDIDEDDELYEKAKKLSKDDIKIIADKLIYKNEYIWEIIHETIANYIENL